MAKHTTYTGMQAKLICNKILNNSYNAETEKYDNKLDRQGRDIDIYSVGYWKEEGTWVAYDNTTGDCWVDEFKTEAKARRWCDYD